MDVAQNSEAMDDDLEVMESVSTPKVSVVRTNANASDDLSIKNKTKLGSNTKNSRDVLSGENADIGDSKRVKSEILVHFKRLGKIDGVEKCQCIHSEKVYTCKTESGTNHLRRHILVCRKPPVKSYDVGELLGNQRALVNKWKFDSRSYRDALSKSIIKHDLPFNYAEYDEVIAMNKILNPDFRPISRNTTKSDCMNVYMNEKEKLKNLLSTMRGRICLTSDVWTAVTVQGYMTVTAHYFDDNWKLNSKLLAFCVLDVLHSVLELSRKVYDVLNDWGIDSKIFSITLDNASNNDKMITYLKERLNLQNGLLWGGVFFHVRCCAHVLNLIVQEGLKAADSALKQIRGSVKYMKSSEGRLKEFQKCIEEVHLSDVGGSFLRLDVSTRWNSTYMMLESAIKYRKAFISLSYNDRNFKICPRNEEWERGEKLCAFLAPFYEITKLLSGSLYPTSDLYFMQIASIEMKLNEHLTCQDEVIRVMATNMKVKFQKYWDDYSVILAFGCIVDPKAKLKFLRYVYQRIYKTDFQTKVDKVKEELYRLFGEYERLCITSSSFYPSSRDGHNSSQDLMTSGSSSIPATSLLDDFHEEEIQNASNEGKSELDIYLEEPVEKKGVDVVQYWKKEKSRFPRLALMAIDILSIPVTIVASESSFSIGGRILNKYRNSLLPETVQALICTRNWLHGYVEALDVPIVEEIQLSKQDSNILDE